MIGTQPHPFVYPLSGSASVLGGGAKGCVVRPGSTRGPQGLKYLFCPFMKKFVNPFYLDQDFSTSALLNFGPDNYLLQRAVLCIVGCSAAASLPLSTCPPPPSRCDNQKFLQTSQDVCWGTNHPWLRTTNLKCCGLTKHSFIILPKSAHCNREKIH